VIAPARNADEPHGEFGIGSETEITAEPFMKITLLVFGVLTAAMAIGTSAQAQNYPWCEYIHGSGGARNCGFVSFAQCQASAQGAGADCRPNTLYEPKKGYHLPLTVLVEHDLVRKTRYPPRIKSGAGFFGIMLYGSSTT
jgi:hypothetical protein